MLNQESGAKEVELHDDDADSMIALLRFIYGLPYTADATKQWPDTLLPHTRVYVVADKYQVEALQWEVCENMRQIIKSKDYLGVQVVSDDCLEGRLKNSGDFTTALQTITAGTTASDTRGRKLLMDVLVQNFPHLRKTDELASLLKEAPELGVELISRDDFECDARGFWSCEDSGCSMGVPRCRECVEIFKPHHKRKYCYDLEWPCPNLNCEALDYPICENCESKTCWRPYDDTKESR